MNCLRPFTLQLQRTETPNDASSWNTVSEYKSVELEPVGTEGWTKLFTGLDKYDETRRGVSITPTAYWKVRREPETGTAERMNNVIEIDGKKYTILNNTVQVEENVHPLEADLDQQAARPKFTLDVTKADAEDTKHKLAGVEFTLEKLTTDGNGNTVVDSPFGKRTGVTNDQAS